MANSAAGAAAACMISQNALTGWASRQPLADHRSPRTGAMSRGLRAKPEATPRAARHQPVPRRRSTSTRVAATGMRTAELITVATMAGSAPSSPKAAMARGIPM